MSLPTLKWRPSPNFSERTARVDLVVIHDAEGTYDGTVNYFATKESQVSAHFVLKDDCSEVTQMVALADKAWHVCAFNSRSVGIEMSGFSAKGFPAVEWETGAEMVAYLLHHLQIPCQWARHGVGPGFTSHFDLGPAGGGHKDPTTDPTKWAYFCDLVQKAHARADFPLQWEQDSAPTKCSLAQKE